MIEALFPQAAKGHLLVSELHLYRFGLESASDYFQLIFKEPNLYYQQKVWTHIGMALLWRSKQ